MTNELKQENTWICFLCQTEYGNRLRYCPKCNIACQHSKNLYETSQLKLKKKEDIRNKRYQDFKRRKKREIYQD